jgi:TolB-like protein/DNA-binding winged helix-turn-helix (wHTH) protein/tetratricopeptide (TPR) repeat protein
MTDANDRPNGRVVRGFRLDGWLVQPSLNAVSRGDAVVHLRPKVMDVLVLLAAHAGEVVAKETVIDTVWAKSFLADTALSRAVFELREAFEDDAQHPRVIETIPKRGYRLVAPVADVAPCGPLAPAPSRTARPRWTRYALATAGVAACLAASALWFAGRHPTSAPPDGEAAPRRRMVVLPFDSLGSPEDAYFAAGITDEITGRLAAVRGLTVISPSTAARYAGTAKSAREVGGELDVDFIVSGTIRWDRAGATGGRVRITPRMVRTSDDVQIWAEVYDRGLRDLLEVQGEIARSVTGAIGVVVSRSAGIAEEEGPPPSPEAYQAYLRGLAHSTMDQRSEAGLRITLATFERSAALDPGFALAHAAVARVRSCLFHRGFERTEENRAAAGKALARAMALASRSPRVHLAAAFYRYWCFRDYTGALDEVGIARRGLGDTAEVLFLEGAMLRRMGRWDEALARFEIVLQLGPLEWANLFDVGDTLMLNRRYAEADKVFLRVIALAPEQCEAYGYRALNFLLWKGAVADARAALDAMPLSPPGWPTVYRFRADVLAGRYEDAVGRLRGAAFDAAENSVMWRPRALLLGQGYALLGDGEAARAAFEEARAAAETAMGTRADDFRIHAALGLALAGLHRTDEAIAAGERAARLCPLSRDALSGSWALLDLAQIHAWLGQPQAACARLETLLAVPSHVSAPLLRLDPAWAPLRDQPCFAALLARHGG